MPRELTTQEILAQLVSFPTVSCESNLALVDWVEGYLAQWGISSRRVYDAQGTKANLYAVIGPQTEGGIALSGHTDVVPVEGQDWNSDPFTLTERDGRLYGRGAVDMKGYLALMLHLAPQAARARLSRPLYLAFSYDEEVGCTGCVDMVEEMARTLPRPAATFVGEPSGMKVVTGHKGSSAFRIRVTGHPVHSSLMHTGVSAIMEGARLIEWANRMNASNRAATPLPVDAPFVPPWTTVHVGTIAGGTANNITAGECVFSLDFRVVPGERIADWEDRMMAEIAVIEQGMKAVAATSGIAVERKFLVPPLAPEPDGVAEGIAKRLARRNGADVVSYGTEAGHFQRAGWSTVVCGPGDIARAHKPDEYVELKEIREGEVFMARLLEELA